jgi:hypothetical protein
LASPETTFRPLAGLFVLGLLGCGVPGAPEPDPGRFDVQAIPVPVDPQHPERVRVGSLEFRGGLELRGDDARFGGLSGLSISRDGRWLVAVTDQGHWVRLALLHDDRERLVGIAEARLGALADLAGAPLQGKHLQDAESLAKSPGGDFLVAFERQHRLWRYDRGSGLSGIPKQVQAPADLGQAPSNAGLEAVTSLPDGRLLMLVEDWERDGHGVGWLGGPGAWAPVAYPLAGQYRPSGAATLASGDVVVLERYYTPATGPCSRLSRIPLATIVPGAVLRGEPLAELSSPLSVDNFEGVDARVAENGEELLYLVSDDNFSPLQRTLLLQFALSPAPAPQD